MFPLSVTLTVLLLPETLPSAHSRGALVTANRFQAEGAEVITGGGRPPGEALRRGCYVEPTLVAGREPRSDRTASPPPPPGVGMFPPPFLPLPRLRLPLQGAALPRAPLLH